MSQKHAITATRRTPLNEMEARLEEGIIMKVQRPHLPPLNTAVHRLEWRLKHDGRAYTYAGVALIFGVLLSRGQLRPGVPQPVHSWSLALFLLGMAPASWVVLTWCASGAAIFRPVFPRTVTLPCSQAQQIEEGVEQAYKRNETLHQEKVKVPAELEQRRLIGNRARKLGLPATVKLPEHPHQEGGRK